MSTQGTVSTRVYAWEESLLEDWRVWVHSHSMRLGYGGGGGGPAHRYSFPERYLEDADRAIARLPKHFKSTIKGWYLRGEHDIPDSQYTPAIEAFACSFEIVNSGVTMH